MSCDLKILIQVSPIKKKNLQRQKFILRGIKESFAVNLRADSQIWGGQSEWWFHYSRLACLWMILLPEWFQLGYITTALGIGNILQMIFWYEIAKQKLLIALTKLKSFQSFTIWWKSILADWFPPINVHELDILQELY